jgi:putative spermidine/putrescine transport system substrate-binding protein
MVGRLGTDTVWLMSKLLLVAVAAALAVPAGGAGSGSVPPTAIGPGEGKLTLLAWEGYAQREWVAPFERQTRCDVGVKYAASSEEMVDAMRSRGGDYDLVSAGGDAARRLIEARDVQPVKVGLIPDWKSFVKPLQAPAHTTVDGVQYGVSIEWGPNTLLYDTTRVKSAPTSWSAIYDQRYKGKITVPDNPIQIADAALYLSKTRPELKVTDPYELDGSQFAAVIALLKEQRPLVGSYWARASDEIKLFKRGQAWLGPAWHYQTDRLLNADEPVREVIPQEGATAWVDAWMLSAKAKHPRCSYLWLRWVSTARVQAQQAVFFGATPANRLACTYMNQIEKGSCSKYHANAPLSYYENIAFWKTPVADCGNGRRNCVDYTKWAQAWRELKG